mgnify:CR=1 FL=1
MSSLKDNRQLLVTAALAALVAVVSAVGGYALFRVLEMRQQADLQTLLVLPEPRGIPAFTLTDQYGADFGPDRLAGKWSLLFFGLRSPGLALVEIIVLWIAIVGTIVLFRRVDPVAAALLAPYLAWVSFASVLNASLWWLNRTPAG